METTMAETNINYEHYLKSIYFDSDHPASYSGLDKLYRFVKSQGKKISKGKIRKWLSKQTVYNKHREVRRNFKRHRIIVPRKYYMFDADTVNMTRYAKHNAYKYILVIMDAMSRFAWTHPLKTLTGKEMIKALKTVLPEHLPQNFHSDLGSEFYNSDVKQYFKSRQIKQFPALTEKKASLAERLIKTLKSKITRYMHHNNTFEWVKVLPEITESYNLTYHRSIDMSPAQAMKTDDVTLWNIQYLPKPVIKKPVSSKPPKPRSIFKFKLGDKVKLSFIKSVFSRAYDSRWSDEYFIVTNRTNKQNIPQYSIKDYSNDPIEGTFYSEELQHVYLSDDVNTDYKIEKILKRRFKNRRKEVLVKWEGWHSKFNSWIPDSEVKDI